jgi:hypothetical protein
MKCDVVILCYVMSNAQRVNGYGISFLHITIYFPHSPTHTTWKTADTDTVITFVFREFMVSNSSCKILSGMGRDSNNDDNNRTLHPSFCHATCSICLLTVSPLLYSQEDLNFLSPRHNNKLPGREFTSAPAVPAPTCLFFNKAHRLTRK